MRSEQCLRLLVLTGNAVASKEKPPIILSSDVQFEVYCFDVCHLKFSAYVHGRR